MVWPDKLKLDHFTYQHLGGMGQAWGQDHMLDRPASWFVGWLAKHKPYSPQPYEQCAKVLREAGQPGKAAEVLYAGKVRELEETPKDQKARRAWLWFLRWTIGFGLTKRFFTFPARWALGFLAVGAAVAMLTPEAAKHSVPLAWAAAYSLGRLLPLVNLHPSFASIYMELGFWPSAWFIVETLFGWFLASLIVAGLAGVGRPGGKN